MCVNVAEEAGAVDLWVGGRGGRGLLPVMLSVDIIIMFIVQVISNKKQRHQNSTGTFCGSLGFHHYNSL